MTQNSPGIADSNPKIKRCAFALTEDQHDLLREACIRIGWTQSQFLRHTALIMAQSVLRTEALADGGVLKGFIPPAHTTLRSTTLRA